MKRTSFAGSLAALFLVINMIFSDLYAGVIVSFFPDLIVAKNLIAELVIFIPPSVVFFIVFKSKGLKIKEVLSLKDLGASNIFLIVLISLLIQPALMSVSALSSLLFENAAADYLEAMADIPALSAILITSLIPAVFEELYFRGIVLSGLKGINAVTACFLCGFLFGMAHLNFQQFSYAFLMGAIFCFFVYATGSIFSSVLSHFIINSSQTILSALALKMVSAEAMATQNQQAVFADIVPFLNLALFSLIPLAGVLYLFYRHNSERIRASFASQGEKTKIITWPFVVLLIIFIYYGLA